jgi:hypothetical protein
VPVVYVDADAAADGDGTSWEAAYRYLQDGLAAARGLRSPVEIWVAEGTYRPDQSEHGAEIPFDPEASFKIQSEMALFGGFSGTEVVRSERNGQEHRTILSGDLQQNDLPDFANRSDNSCHVVRIENTDASARLDSVVVKSGHARYCDNNDGGGVLLVNSSAVLARCELSDNDALQGGGMLAYRGYPTVVASRFLENRAYNGGGLVQADMNYWATVLRSEFVRNQGTNYGGGAHGRLLVDGSLFLSNTALWGGGLYLDGRVVLSSTRFFGNSAEFLGGGTMVGSAGAVEVNNCVFSGNSAGDGGAVFFYGGRSLKVNNSTLVGNLARYHGGGVNRVTSVENSVIVGNSPNQFAASERAISFSCVEGLNEGTGNIPDCEPSFVDADGADDIPGTIDDDLRLQSGSDGIDAGSNYALPPDTFDLDGDGDVTEPLPVDLNGNPRRVDDTEVDDTGIGNSPLVDMGAYEHQ